MAGNTLYPGVKSLMIKFSQSLDAEYRAAGLKVTAVCPGFTKTEFAARPASRQIMEREPGCSGRRRRRWSRATIRANERGKVVVVPGWHNEVAAALMRGLPRAAGAARSSPPARRSIISRIRPRESRGDRAMRALRHRDHRLRRRRRRRWPSGWRPTGKSILILERGEHLPREAENWNPKAVFIQHRYRTKEQWYDRRGQPFTPNTHYWVGGNTTFYGAALMRLRKGDFDETQHAGGVSPAWPISLTDLAPYYDEAETLWQVHGARGDDPTENGDEPPYAYPADPPRSGHRAAEDPLGEPGLAAVLPAAGRPPGRGPPGHLALHPCKTCGGYPCLLKAKCDARTVAVEPMLDAAERHPADRAQGRCGWRPTPRASTVTEVVCETEHGEERWSGDIVVLAAGAVNTAALLLASANAAHPERPRQRLRPGRPQLHVPHPDRDGLADRRALPDAAFPKTLAVNDFYWSDPRGGFDLPDGPHPAAGIHDRPDAGGRGLRLAAAGAGARHAGQRGGLADALDAGDLRGPADARQPGAADDATGGSISTTSTTTSRATSGW